MKTFKRPLAGVAATAVAAALLAIVPGTPAYAGISVCKGVATAGGASFDQDAVADSTTSHDQQSPVFVGAPTRNVTVTSISSIDGGAAQKAYSFGGRLVDGTSALKAVASNSTPPPSPNLQLVIPRSPLNNGPTTLTGKGTFSWTPPTTPQVVTFTTPDEDFAATTKFYDDGGGIKIDVKATCNPAAAEQIGASVRVMAKSSTTMGAVPQMTANSSVSVPVTVSVTGGTVSGKVGFIVDGAEPTVFRNLTAGQTNLSLSGLSQGSHTVSVRFVPNDANLYEGSVSAPQTINVAPPAIQTTTTLTLDKTAISTSQSVTATAKVVADFGAPAGNVIFSVDGTDTKTVAVAPGTTSVSTTLSALSIGARDIQARFVPQFPLQHTSSESGIATVVVRAPSTTTITKVTITPNPASATQLLTATAKVTATTGTPVGFVQFAVDGEPVGGATAVNAAGDWVRQFKVATPGAHTVTADFTPTNPADFESSSGATPLEITASGTPTTTTMTITPTLGTSADTYVATVKVARTTGGVAPGNVNIMVDGAQVATRALDASGNATITLPALDSGARKVRAVFAPSSTSDQASQSAEQTVDVSILTSTTTLTLNSTSISEGLDVVAEATVSMSVGSPNGTVDFMSGNTKLGSAPIKTGGKATLTMSPPQGNYNVTAVFVPAKPLQQKTSTSAAVPLAVGPAVAPVSTTTTATLKQDSVTINEQGQVDVTVAAAGATPRGKAQITIGGDTVSADLVDGKATVQLPLLAMGDYTFKVSFLSSNTKVYLPSESTPLTVHVVRAAASTTTYLSVTPIVAASGEQIVAEGAVTSSRDTPKGHIAFSVDGGAEVLVPLAGFTASKTFTGLSAGDHQITARYEPGTNRLDFAKSSAAPVTVTVLSTPQVKTATGVSVVPGTVRENEPASATVKVSADGAVPQGSVVVTMKDGAGFSETYTADLTGGVATVPMLTYQAGVFDVQATYVPAQGTHYDPSSSGTRTLTVAPAPTGNLVSTTKLVLSPADATVGDPVRATASVTWVGGVPQGAVKFFSDGTQVGQPVTLGADGTATISLDSSTAGSRSVSAQFVSTDQTVTTNSSTDPQVLRIRPAAIVSTMTEVKLAPSTLVLGQQSVATATVKADSGIPEGSVVFSVDGNETTVPLTGVTATLPIKPSEAITSEVTATFIARKDSGFADSAASSPAWLKTTKPVTAAATTTSFTLNKATAFVDERVLASVAVSSTQSTPVGQAVLKVGDTTFRAPLVDGKASVSLPPLAAGSHSVTVSFVPASGTPYQASAAGTQSVTITTRPAAIPTNTSTTTTTTTTSQTAPAAAAAADTSTVLTLSSSTGNLGGTVKATARVSDGATGSVRFSTGWTSVTVPVINGSASADIPLEAMGTSQIAALFLPDTTAYTSSFSTATVTVLKALSQIAVKATSKKGALDIVGTVSAIGGLTFPSGKVKITVLADGKKVVSTSVPMNSAGKFDRNVKVRRAKKYTVIVSYKGSTTTLSATKKITAKGRK